MTLQGSMLVTASYLRDRCVLRNRNPALVKGVYSSELVKLKEGVMKRSFTNLRFVYICALLVWACLSGCSVFQEHSSEEGSISISIGEAFKNDQVRVLLDDGEVFFDTITSSMMQQPPICCAPSAVIEQTVIPGIHQLRVEINGEEKGAYEFDTQGMRFVWFTYNRETRAVRFGGSKEQLPGEG